MVEGKKQNKTFIKTQYWRHCQEATAHSYTIPPTQHATGFAHTQKQRQKDTHTETQYSRGDVKSKDFSSLRATYGNVECSKGAG